MRILGCARITHLHGHLGGMEIATRNLYEGLAARGIKVNVITTSLEKDQEHLISEFTNGVCYDFIPNCTPGKYSSQFHNGVSSYLKEMCDRGEKPDLVHSASAGATGACQNEMRVPVVATWHGTFLEESLDHMAESVYLRNGRLLPVHVERLLLNKILPLVTRGMERDRRFGIDFDGHIAISDFMHKVLLSYGLSRPSVAMIPNCVDQSFFDARKLTKQNCQTELDFAHPERIVLGLVGRGVPSKGYKLLFSALNDLDASKFALLMVGDESPVPDDIRVPFKQIRVPYGKMPIAYRSMDLFVNPTIRLSGFDLTVQEALCAGVRTLVSDTSQYKNFFEKYTETSAALEPFSIFGVGNWEQLRRAIESISQLPSNINDADLEFFKQSFSLKSMIDSHIDFFDRVISRVPG